MITLIDGTAPTGDEADATSTAPNGDPNSNLSVDFGFSPTPTSVQLAYFLASSSGLDWTTATEVDNLGFNVYFKPGQGATVKLNGSLVQSRQITGQKPQDYHLAATGTGNGQYFLEEVGLNGGTRQYGPFVLDQAWGEKPVASATASRSVAKNNGVTNPINVGKPKLLSQTSFNLQTDQAGVYHLTYEYLLSKGIDFAGADLSKVELKGAEGPAQLHIVTAQPGKFAAGDYIEWQAQKFHNIYTDYNTYVLSLGSGTNTIVGSGVANNGGPTTARIERNLFYWGSADANTDPWFWDYLSSYNASTGDKQYGFDLSDLTSGGQATGLKLHLRGMNTDAAQAQNHRVHAWLNGTDLGAVSFGGLDEAVLQTSGATALTLQATGNQLRLVVEQVDGSALSYNNILLDYAEFTYPHNPSPAIGTVKSVRVHQPTPYQASEAVDYVIIAHPAFMANVQPLVDLHTAEGLKVKVVDVNSIYDTYSNGVVDGAAIQAYLAAQQQSNLKYALLVGGDSYDPMNYYASTPGYSATSASLVPSVYTLDRFHFRAPSDQLLAGLHSSVAIGRLPAQSLSELDTMVNKTLKLAHASQSHALSSGVTFVADDGTDFNGLNDTLAATASGYSVEKDYRSSGLSSDQLRAKVTDRINGGNLLLNYTGHSGTNAWGLQTFFRQSDIEALTNSANPLVVVQWACYNSFYSLPYSRSMAETWLTANGGAAFVLGSSAQGQTADQTELATRFYHNVLVDKLSLGEALARAKTDMLAANPALADIAQTYLILGDPALKF